MRTWTNPFYLKTFVDFWNNMNEISESYVWYCDSATSNTDYTTIGITFTQGDYTASPTTTNYFLSNDWACIRVRELQVTPAPSQSRRCLEALAAEWTRLQAHTLT